MRKALLLILCAWCAVAQHTTPGNDLAPLIPGIGNVNHVVSTRNSAAQRYFNQGLALIYGFNHEEAERSFRRASILDANCAMAYWGLALALGPNYNEPDVEMSRTRAAIAAIEKARARSRLASPQERAYIEALAQRYSADPKPDKQQLARHYSSAMKLLAETYPDDLDAATLYAESLMELQPWKLWNGDGSASAETSEIVAVLTSVLRRDQQHLGANHFYIHALEASTHPEHAMESAERLKELAPASGHLLHMPSHIYMRVGNYRAASEANEAAIKADRAYIGTYDVRGMYPLMYYSHNLQFLAISAGMEGRFATADAAATELDANVAPYAAHDPGLEAFLTTGPLLLVRFGKWQRISELQEPDTRLRIVHAVWQFSRGMMFVAEKQLGPAVTAAAALTDEAKKIAPAVPYGSNSADDILKIASMVLNGQITHLQAKSSEADAFFDSATRAEDELGYNEPPDWFLPVRETHAMVLASDKRYKEAEAVFRQELERHPNNPRALFGLARCFESEGRVEEYEAAWTTYKKFWAGDRAPW